MSEKTFFEIRYNALVDLIKDEYGASVALRLCIEAERKVQKEEEFGK